MKISDLIADICEQADTKFTGKHPNDACSVNIYFNGIDWQIGLFRPTDKDLSHGEIAPDLLHTVEETEQVCGFFCSGPTLLGTLRELQDKVFSAEEWEQ